MKLSTLRFWPLLCISTGTFVCIVFQAKAKYFASDKKLFALFPKHFGLQTINISRQYFKVIMIIQCKVKLHGQCPDSIRDQCKPL